jgi:hypothetical protein
MESNQLIQQGEKRKAILVSNKLLNKADGLIWPTEGRLSAFSGYRCAFLLVNQTKVEIAPYQQARKIGQVIPYGRNLL